MKVAPPIAGVSRSVIGLFPRGRGGIAKMKLADIDVDELVRALGKERSKWIDAASEEKRRSTEAEKATICMLAALEHVLSNIAH